MSNPAAIPESSRYSTFRFLRSPDLKDVGRKVDNSGSWTSVRFFSARVAGATFLVASVLSPFALRPSSVSAQNAASDYHTEAFGDPMDFSNPEDLVINTDEAMFVGGSNKQMADGQLHFDANGPFQFDPVWAGFPTGIAHGHEGGRFPIDTSRYRRFVIRMNAPEGAPVGLRWFSCLEQTAACEGGQAFTAHAGWNTYDIVLGDNGTVPGLPVNWTGQMLGLRFVGYGFVVRC